MNDPATRATNLDGGNVCSLGSGCRTVRLQTQLASSSATTKARFEAITPLHAGGPSHPLANANANGRNMGESINNDPIDPQSVQSYLEVRINQSINHQHGTGGAARRRSLDQQIGVNIFLPQLFFG